MRMNHKKKPPCGLLIQDPGLFIDSETVREVRVNAAAAQCRFITLYVQPVHRDGDIVTASTRRRILLRHPKRLAYGF